MTFKVADAFIELHLKDSIDADRRAVEAKLASIRDRTVKIGVKADESGIRQIAARLATLRDKTLKVDIDDSGVRSAVSRIKAALNSIRNQTIKIAVDDAAIRRSVSQIKSLRDIKVRVRVDIAGIDPADVRGLASALGRLSRTGDVTIRINLVGAAAAYAWIKRLDAALAALPRTVHVHIASSGLPALLSGIGSARSAMSGLGSIRLPNLVGPLLIGLAAVPAAAGAAAAAIAAIPAAGASLGLVGGVLAGSFSGVGDALKGFTADQDKAAKGGGGGSAANAARSSARAIRDATQQINDAKREQARTARDTAQQIEDAERGVQDAARQTARAQDAVDDARRNAARVARDEGRSVQDAAEAIQTAEQESARAVERAEQDVEAASRRLSDAIRTETRAQADLNDARAAAAQQLDDLKEKVSDLALDQTGASIAVREAQAELERTNNDALATDLDKEKAAYNLAVAQERLSDLQREAAQAAKENDAAQVKGVEGAQQVVDAKLRVEDATQSAHDAETALVQAQQDSAQTQIDSAKRVADAQEAYAIAQERAAEANADAQERVSDAMLGVDDALRAQDAAERQLARTKQQAAESNADAAERVANAQQGLKDASEDANAALGAGGAAAASQFALAMAKLTPLQRDLVRELLRWKDIMHSLGQTASNAFLPGFIQMLKDAEGLQGIFNSALQRTGTIMGDTARDMGALFKSEDFKRNLDALLKSTDPITKSIGRLFVDMTSKMVEFGAKMAPAAAGFATFIDGVNKGLQGFFDALSTPESVDAFKSILESLGSLMETLLPILGRLVAELAERFAPALRDFADWCAAHKEGISAFFTVVADAVGMFFTAIGWVADKVGEAWRGLQGFADGLDGLPDRVKTSASNLMGGLRQGLDDRIGQVKEFFTVTLPDAVIGTFKSIFGIASPSTVFAEFGRNLIDGLLQGLRDLVSKVSEKWTELTTWWSAQWTVFSNQWKAFWDKVGTTVSQAWDAIKTWVSTKWTELTTWLSVQWDTYSARWKAFWDKVGTTVSQAWDAIKGWVQTKWSELTTWLSAQWTTYSNQWKAFWDKVGTTVGQAWDAIKAKVNDAWTWIKVHVWDPMVNFVKVTIPGAFDTAATAIGRAWDRIKELAAAPVRFIVNTVYNGGIVPAWNKVAGLVNLPGLGTVNLGFAAGGVAPGRDLGYDYVPAMLRGGEGILVPEATRMLGGEPGIHALNRRAERQHFASGGVAGYSGSGSASTVVTGSVQSAGLLQQLLADAAGTARNLFSSALGGVGGTPGGGSWRDAMTRMPGKMVDGLVEKIKSAAASLVVSSAAPAGAGVQRWAPVVLQALGMMGQPASLLQTVLRRMQQESGGNPLAINNWDSNAARGTPSKGLMQTIDPTFRAYHFPGTSNSIYDPLANILASMRYAMARYGSLAAAYNRAGGYDEGGIATGIGMLPKYTSKPERVLSPAQTEAFERLVNQLDSPRGTGGVTVQNLHVNVSGVLDFRQRDVATRQIVADLMAQIDAIERAHA